MTDDIVSSGVARSLYGAGFDLETRMSYYINSWIKTPRLVDTITAEEESRNHDGTDIYPAPNFWKVLGWLRTKNLELELEYAGGEDYNWSLYIRPQGDLITLNKCEFHSPREAFEDGIMESLKIIKDENL